MQQHQQLQQPQHQQFGYQQMVTQGAQGQYPMYQMQIQPQQMNPQVGYAQNYQLAQLQHAAQFQPQVQQGIQLINYQNAQQQQLMAQQQKVVKAQPQVIPYQMTNAYGQPYGQALVQQATTLIPATSIPLITTTPMQQVINAPGHVTGLTAQMQPQMTISSAQNQQPHQQVNNSQMNQQPQFFDALSSFENANTPRVEKQIEEIELNHELNGIKFVQDFELNAVF